jgi:hypothetical protein
MKIAKQNKIELWNFGNLIIEICDFTKSKSTYFKDDSLRTIQLLAKILNKENP